MRRLRSRIFGLGFCLLQPGAHIHLVVHRGRAPDVLLRFAALAGAAVQPAEAEMTMGHERTQAEGAGPHRAARGPSRAHSGAAAEQLPLLAGTHTVTPTEISAAANNAAPATFRLIRRANHDRLIRLTTGLITRLIERNRRNHTRSEVARELLSRRTFAIERRMRCFVGRGCRVLADWRRSRAAQEGDGI